MDGRVIRLPEGHDPDSFVREHGPHAFFELADSAMDIADYFVSRLQRGPGGTLTGDAQLVSKAQEVLSQVPDAAKSQYLRVRLAERLGISPELLKPDPHGRRIFAPPPPPPKEPGPAGKERRDRLAEKLVAQVVIHPETAELLEGDLAEAWPDDPTRPVLEAILGQLRSQGRLVPESLRLDYDDKASSLVSGALMSPRQWPPGTLPGQSLDGVGKLADKLKHNLLRALQKEISMEVHKAQAEGDQARVDWLFAAKEELAKGSLRPLEAAAKIRGQGSSSESRAPAPKPAPV
jgi:DNA primase